jgi:predicted nucleic acid-binding protein
MEADASYIVTEDKDLLDLKQYHGIAIMSRRDFVDELDRLGIP